MDEEEIITKDIEERAKRNKYFQICLNIEESNLFKAIVMITIIANSATLTTYTHD